MRLACHLSRLVDVVTDFFVVGLMKTYAKDFCVEDFDEDFGKDFLF